MQFKKKLQKPVLFAIFTGMLIICCFHMYAICYFHRNAKCDHIMCFYNSRETVSMRDKEGFQDYRFMPEPNLLPVHVYDNSTVPCDTHSEVVNIDMVREQMPELPHKKREHLQKRYNLSIEVINILLVSYQLKACCKFTLVLKQK